MSRNKYILFALLLSLSAGAFAQKAERDYIRKGNRLFKDSVFVDAEVNYRKALEANPKSTISMYNLGNTLSQQQKFKDAMEQYGNDRPDIREDKNDPNLLAFCWVVDFPFFEATEKSDNPDATGAWTYTHNPFSRPIEADMVKLMEKRDIGSILTTQYDIILNGYEIGGGSIRNHTYDSLAKVFEILGHNMGDIETNFGHMLHAFKTGTPPHGGIAWGLDRLIMLLLNEPNIREVIAFPKSGEGKDPMMHAPSPVADKQLEELNLVLKKIEK